MWFAIAAAITGALVLLTWLLWARWAEARRARSAERSATAAELAALNAARRVHEITRAAEQYMDEFIAKREALETRRQRNERRRGR